MIRHSNSLILGVRVYYERSVTCNVEIEWYTLRRGNSFHLQDGCAENYPDSTLYPAKVGPVNFHPVPKIDGNNLPYTISVIAAEVSHSHAVVNFEASATDKCDTSPSIILSHPSGYSFPIGSTDVTVTATDSYGNDGIGILTVIVEAAPTKTPTNSPSLSPTVSNY